jgi:hypothetical protein
MQRSSEWANFRISNSLTLTSVAGRGRVGRGRARSNPRAVRAMLERFRALVFRELANLRAVGGGGGLRALARPRISRPGVRTVPERDGRRFLQILAQSAPGTPEGYPESAFAVTLHDDLSLTKARGADATAPLMPNQTNGEGRTTHNRERGSRGCAGPPVCPIGSDRLHAPWAGGGG